MSGSRFTGANWTNGPASLKFQDAVVETVVTHTTRTTTSFAPLQLPRIPPPDNLGNPSHLFSEQYPLANAPTPDELKWFAMRVGDQRVIVTEDGKVDINHDESGSWQRTLPSLAGTGAGADQKFGLLEALNRSKGKEVRKRSLQEDNTQQINNQLTPAGSRTDEFHNAYPSPPRKRIRRPEEVSTPIGSTGVPLSPLPSPELESPPPLSPLPETRVTTSAPPPALGSGYELAALYSLPAIISQFDGLHDKLQEHVLMQLLRRSRIQTIQTVANFAGGALKRDFIACLPRELAVQVLQSVDAKTLAQATRVSKKWRSVIDSERSIWRQRLIEEGLHEGHGVEEEEEAVMIRRMDQLATMKRAESASGDGEGDDLASMADESETQAWDKPSALKHVFRRRQQRNDNWFKKRPAHNSFPGHGTNVVTCLQFDRDKIVSASDDNTINVYDTASGKLRKKLVGHGGGVWALQYRGHALVTGSTDRSVRVWDLDTLRETHIFSGHTSTVRCLQIVEPVLDTETGLYYPPQPYIVTGSRDHTVRVWKLPRKGQPAVKKYKFNEEGEQVPDQVMPAENPYHIHALIGHTDAIRSLDTYGRYCVSGSYDTTVRVWDLVKGKCLHILRGHENKVYSIVYDRYRHRAASGSMDNTVKIWDLDTGTCLHTLTGHTSLVGLLGLSPNHLVSAAADSSLRIWNADNTVELKQVLRNNGGAITCFQHDEHKVVSGSDGMLKLWDIRRGTFVRDLVMGISSVWQVGFNGNLLVAASNRSGTTVFDVFDFGELDDPSGVDNDDLDDLIRPPWERELPSTASHAHAHAQTRQKDHRPIDDLDLQLEDEDEDDIDDEIDWDDSFVTYSPLYRLNKQTNTYHPVESFDHDKNYKRRSERLASKSSNTGSPLAGPSTKSGPSAKGKSKRVSFTQGGSPSLRKTVSSNHRSKNETQPDVVARKTEWAAWQSKKKATASASGSAAAPSPSTHGKGKGKAPAGPSFSAMAAAGPSGPSGSPSLIKPVERGTTRVTRSRSGPGNSSSPARYTRTSSAGHLGLAGSSAHPSGSGRHASFAPVFDDEDEGMGPALARSRPRQLSDEDDNGDEDEEDELDSMSDKGEQGGLGDDQEDDGVENALDPGPGSGSESGEGQLETDDDMSDGID